MNINWEEIVRISNECHLKTMASDESWLVVPTDKADAVAKALMNWFPKDGKKTD